MIGIVPIIELTEIHQDGTDLVTTYRVLEKEFPLRLPIPEGGKVKELDGALHIELPNGERILPSLEQAVCAIDAQHVPLTFDVQYIGQAYGKGGSRSALDRLIKHETLQKIALMGTKPGYRLELLLIAVQPSNSMITVLNPFAQNNKEGSSRIKKGLDKLFGTSEKERVALYEACMIRYFQPRFNKEFKNSFPSTNMKVLRDCYHKDFSALIAEFCFDKLRLG